jgi:hypothetical protein
MAAFARGFSVRWNQVMNLYYLAGRAYQLPQDHLRFSITNRFYSHKVASLARYQQVRIVGDVFIMGQVTISTVHGLLPGVIKSGRIRVTGQTGLTIVWGRLVFNHIDQGGRTFRSLWGILKAMAVEAEL